MNKEKFYKNIFSIFLVSSQGDIYVKDYGKFILKKYLDKFPKKPEDFYQVVKDNYDDIKSKVFGVIEDKQMREYEYYNFIEGGDLDERDWLKLVKSLKRIEKFSLQLYSQELNWVSGRYYQNIMKEVEASVKIKKDCERTVKKNIFETKEALKVKQDCKTKMEEMTLKTSSMERAFEKIREEGKEIPECCICVNVQDLLVFAPCGHQIVCQNCVKKMRKMECPMCRTEIKSYCKIFT